MFSVDIRDNGVSAALGDLVKRLANPEPVLRSIGEDIVARAKQRFATSTGPDGQRWRPNARATIEAYLESKGGFGKRGINKKGQALAMGKKPLVGDTGDLRRQFHVTATGSSVTVSHSAIYAAIQQFGGKAGRGHAVNIPARPFLPFTENGELYADDRAAIMAAINDWLIGK